MDPLGIVGNLGECRFFAAFPSREESLKATAGDSRDSRGSRIGNRYKEHALSYLTYPYAIDENDVVIRQNVI